MVQMTEAQFRRASEEYEGRCLECGATAIGVEPDARRYSCEECGRKAVYGLEELMVMGQIELAD